MKGCFSSLHCLPPTCYSQGQMGGGGKRRPGKGGVVSAASMRALKPTSAFRTGTRRSRRRLENQTLSSRMSAEPSPALSSLFNGQNPHQSLCQAPAPARRPALDQGESPDGPGGPGTGSVPRPRRPPGMPRPLPASTGSPRNPDEVSSPAQSELARCAPSPWCAASRVAPGSPRSPSPEPASRRRRRSRSREDADKAWRLGAAAGVADGGRGGGGFECHLPGRCALGRRGNSADGARARAGAGARAECGGDEGRPPSSAAPAPPPSSCLHPGGNSRWGDAEHAPQGLAPALGSRTPDSAASGKE